MVRYEAVEGVATMGVVAVVAALLVGEGGAIDGLGVGNQFVKGGDACRTEGFVGFHKRRVAIATMLGLGALLALTGVVVDGLVIDVCLVHVALEGIVEMRQTESGAEQHAPFVGGDEIGELLGGGKQHAVNHLHDAVLDFLVLEDDARVAVDVVVAGDGVDIDLYEAGVHVGRAHHAVVEVCGEVGNLDDMAEGDGVAVGIGELADVGVALLAQIDVKGIVGRCETGVFTVGSKQLLDTCALQHIGERAERLGTVVEIVGNHLTREGVEILLFYLLHAGRQQQCKDHHADRPKTNR